MNDPQKQDQPEIMPPVPDVERKPERPEIPPDKDTPEKKSPIKART
jgi:hypothetical protein